MAQNNPFRPAICCQGDALHVIVEARLIQLRSSIVNDYNHRDWEMVNPDGEGLPISRAHLSGYPPNVLTARNDVVKFLTEMFAYEPWNKLQVHAIVVHDIIEEENEGVMDECQKVDVILVREKELDTSGKGSGSMMQANKAAAQALK